MPVRAKWQNRETVMNRLREMVPNAEAEAAKAQIGAANDLARAIRNRAPKKTGEYASTIRGGRLADGGGSLVGIGPTKDPNATGVFARFTWRFIEFGTKPRSHKSGKSVGAMPARPHIFPTYRSMKKQIRRTVATAVNRAIRKAKKG